MRPSMLTFWPHSGRTAPPRLAAIMAMLLIATLAARGQATVVRYTTSVGNVDVRLYNSLTPNSVTNFMNYVNANKYSGTFIHRVPQNSGGGTSNFVVQGGGFLLNNSIFSATGIAT